MNSFREWKLLNEFADPEWENLKYVWGGGTKHVDVTLVNKLKLKVQSIVDQYIRDLGDPKVTSFRELPPHMRDSLAQSLVVATLKAFYTGLEGTPTGGASMFDQQKLGKAQAAPTPQPQTDVAAPSGWKG
jgi:hypothetical protein